MGQRAETKNNSKDPIFKETQKGRKGVTCKEEAGRRSRGKLQAPLFVRMRLFKYVNKKTLSPVFSCWRRRLVDFSWVSSISYITHLPMGVKYFTLEVPKR